MLFFQFLNSRKDSLLNNSSLLQSNTDTKHQLKIAPFFTKQEEREKS
jgi:hypothetical protein